MRKTFQRNNCRVGNTGSVNTETEKKKKCAVFIRACLLDWKLLKTKE